VTREYGAPWSGSLRTSSVESVAVLLCVSALGILSWPRPPWIWSVAIIGGPLVIIRRRGWTTPLSFAGVRSASGDVVP
jgi:hypothetical protein